MDNRIFLCIDLKSFYASVECIERGLDPMTTNLLVADVSEQKKQSALQSALFEILWYFRTCQTV